MKIGVWRGFAAVGIARCTGTLGMASLGVSTLSPCFERAFYK